MYIQMPNKHMKNMLIINHQRNIIQYHHKSLHTHQDAYNKRSDNNKC